MGLKRTCTKPKLFEKERIATLTDGVYAFAMTLLVTGLDIPSINGILTSNPVDTILASLLPDLLHYIVAFILLANFWWANHERSHYLHSIDTRMVLLNLAGLLFVGLIPFSTNLVGDYPMNTHAAIIFEMNLFFLGLISVLQWNTVKSGHLCIKSDVDYNEIHLQWRDSLIYPVLSLAGIGLALSSMPGSVVVYVLAPVYIVLARLHDSHPLRKEVRGM